VLASSGMRIAVIGKGNIGGSLGTKWRAAGHDVVYGARDASGAGPGGAPVLAVADALDGADVVLLAVPGGVVPDVIAEQNRVPFRSAVMGYRTAAPRR